MLVGVSPWKIRRWVAAGLLPAYRSLGVVGRHGQVEASGRGPVPQVTQPPGGGGRGARRFRPRSRLRFRPLSRSRSRGTKNFDNRNPKTLIGAIQNICCGRNQIFCSDGSDAT